MCGLFGFSTYGNIDIKNLSGLTNSLAGESAIRGTDATGIAFNKNNKINILKEAKSAYRMNLKHADDTKALIGHTRHSTQGSEKKNINNHPFYGKCANTKFAFAHNGVLSNDKSLRKSLKLPKAKIETDSYIAVQLLEQKNELTINSIKYVAEKVEGSFSFSILDEQDNVYLVKGDSPLSILHFPKLKLYVYASTEQILWKALVETNLLKSLKNSEFEEVKIDNGDILKICNDGTLVYDKFDYVAYVCCGSYNWWNCKANKLGEDMEDQYLEDLKMIASCQGFSPDTIEELYQDGFTFEEIEEYLYTGDFMEV